MGDDAFQLTDSMVKPFPKEVLGLNERIYNYRLSRARRIIENTFGIMVTRFRIFRRPIIARIEVVENVTKACIALHNFLMFGRTFDNMYCPEGFVDEETCHGYNLGDWRREQNGTQGLQQANNLGSNNYTRDAKLIRERFRDFFCSDEGAVHWQLDTVTSTHNTFDLQD